MHKDDENDFIDMMETNFKKFIRQVRSIQICDCAVVHLKVTEASSPAGNKVGLSDDRSNSKCVNVEQDPGPQARKGLDFPTLSPDSEQNCKSYAVSCTGGIVGAVVGGTVFGSVITMIVFLCFRRAFLSPKTRNSDCKPRSDENLQESLPPVDETVYNEINDQAVIKIQPMRRPESAHVSTREETYSHLHESEKEDMNESYDHARPVRFACVGEDGYRVLTRVGNNNREVQTTATYDVPSKIQNDNYFIIEPQ
uniref:Uncharacterized protein n=1 Tax=Magallana gigas TaxID=29159 RepID=A0A8W8LZH7_MAGGI